MNSRSARVISLPTREEQPTRLKLASARRLDVDPTGTSFQIQAPDGKVELTVRITAEGPVLTFAAASIEIAKTSTLKVDVDELTLRARKHAEIECLGTVSQKVIGDSVTHCEGRMQVDAAAVAVTSDKGNLSLESKHDVAINGERVLLNC